MKKRKELYKFTDGRNSWYFTSGDSSENYDGKVYTPVAISRTAIESKDEMSKDVLNITIDKRNLFAIKCLTELMYNEVRVDIFTKEDSAFKASWQGRLSVVKPDIGIIMLVFESDVTDLRRVGGRIKFQRTCPHALYGPRCQVNDDTYKLKGSIESFTSTTISVPICSSKEDGYFSGGKVRLADGTMLFIISHVGSELTLIREFSGASIKDNVWVHPGCNKSVSTCKDKFNNLIHFGGFPYIPTQNPFVGDSIY